MTFHNTEYTYRGNFDKVLNTESVKITIKYHLDLFNQRVDVNQQEFQCFVPDEFGRRNTLFSCNKTPIV